MASASGTVSGLLVALAAAPFQRDADTRGTALWWAPGFASAAAGAAGIVLVVVAAVVLAGVGMVGGVVAAVPVAPGAGMMLAAVVVDIVGMCMVRVPAAVGHSREFVAVATLGPSGSGVACRMAGN